MDETNTLRSGEVFIQIKDKISGERKIWKDCNVLVGRNPSLHKGYDLN
jgi:hypothetical protein